MSGFVKSFSPQVCDHNVKDYLVSIEKEDRERFGADEEIQNLFFVMAEVEACLWALRKKNIRLFWLRNKFSVNSPDSLRSICDIRF